MKRTILELEKGKIEFSDDGETKAYTYAGTPIDNLSDEQRQEILDSPQFKAVVTAINELAEQIAKIMKELVEVAVPILNKVAGEIAAAAAEAEKAKKKPAKKPAAKKVKTDEKK